MNEINCYWGYGKKYSMVPQNWPPHLRNCSSKLQGVKLTNWDFEKIINEAPDDAFLFIDPPYFNADQDKFYNVTFSKDDHFRLAETLKKNSHRFKFLLTYDNSIEIRELYQWAHEILDKEWNYTINRTDDQKKNGDRKTGEKGKRYRGQEVFIFNYEPSVVVEPEQLTFPLIVQENANLGHFQVEQKVYAG
jgi:DNA adenine methylase